MHWCFQRNDISKIVHFGILIYILSWRQQKHQCLCFHYWHYLTNFWRNNWRSIIDIVERLLLGTSEYTCIFYENCDALIPHNTSSWVSCTFWNVVASILIKKSFNIINKWCSVHNLITLLLWTYIPLTYFALHSELWFRNY